LILGDFRRFFTRDILNNHDIISGSATLHTLGPFTLFRNTPVINQLYRRSKLPLELILRNPMQMCFDEWGCFKEGFYRFGMAGIVESNIEKLGIRWTGIDVIYWDGSCSDLLGRSRPCRECHYFQMDGTQQLFQTHEDSHKVDNEVFFCHFQYTKDTVIEPSLANDPELLKEMLDRGMYRLNFRDGFSLLNDNLQLS